MSSIKNNTESQEESKGKIAGQKDGVQATGNLSQNGEKPQLNASTADKEILKLNILVIDDSNALRRVLIKFLQSKFHCNIFEVEHGKAGLELIAKQKGNIHLVLCDLMMPVMDGMTFLTQIKAQPEYKDIPVVILTAKNDRDTVIKCINLGASDFIVKPYDLSSVLKKIERYIKTKI